jgi:hypothetical protein
VSYSTLAAAARDNQLADRIAACAATQGEPEPEQWARLHMWALAASPGWDDAYSYAVTAGNPAPGNDSGVITDGMILAAVQPLLSSAS